MRKLFKLLTFGGLLGLIAGLLFAPEKGEETRKKVAEMLGKGKDKIDEIKSEFSKGDEA
jgi:gas vesicle protein